MVRTPSPPRYGTLPGSVYSLNTRPIQVKNDRMSVGQGGVKLSDELRLPPTTSSAVDGAPGGRAASLGGKYGNTARRTASSGQSSRKDGKSAQRP